MQIPCKLIRVYVPSLILYQMWSGYTGWPHPGLGLVGGALEKERKTKAGKEKQKCKSCSCLFLFVFLLKAAPQTADGGAAMVCSVKLGSDHHGCKKIPLYIYEGISSSRYSTSSLISVTSHWGEQTPQAVRFWLGRTSGNFWNILSIRVCCLGQLSDQLMRGEVCRKPF